MSDLRMVRRCLMVLLAGALFGCHPNTNYRMVAPRPPVTYEKLGPAEGVGCGTSWLMIGVGEIRTPHIGYESRVDRARQAAIDSVPGATNLINVSILETEVFYLLGDTDCVTIRGEAIR